MYELFILAQQDGQININESWTLYTVYVLLFALTVLPPLSFVIVGWRIRKKAILHGFDETSARLYLKLFHPSSHDNTADPHEELLRLYHAHFGRGKFFIPFLLLACLTAVLLYGCLITVVDWIATNDIEAGFLPIEVVLAIMGGYTWATSDQIERYGRDNVRPGDLYWGSFRLAIAVPMAYALSRVLDESLAIPLAFLLGTFPTSTIMTLSRRLVLSKFPEKLARVKSETDDNSLLSMPDISTSIAERLHTEDIMTVAQLAYADPVRLTIRTGLGYTYVTTLTCQALAKMYFKDTFDAAVACGLLGACECRSLSVDLASDDEDVRNAATSLLTTISTTSGRPAEAVRNLLAEIAGDKFVEFYHLSWSEIEGEGQESDEDPYQEEQEADLEEAGP